MHRSWALICSAGSESASFGLQRSALLDLRALRAFLPIYSLYQKLMKPFLKALFWRLRTCYDLGNAQDSIFNIQGFLGYLGGCPQTFLE